MLHRVIPLILFSILSVLPLTTNAYQEAPSQTYVQSGPGGIFYARCTPGADDVTFGTTEIFRVRTEGDERVDHYGWFTREGVVLGWSPIAGKIGVMALYQDPAIPRNPQAEFSFYLGGKYLKTWTTPDLEHLGAELTVAPGRGTRASYRVLGCEQIPGTNDYVFEIELKKGAKLSFDILTGDLRKK